MQIANVRYGRPKGSGLDDRQQLATIAALLAANPKLKPTTAIRSLGVEDPSDIRRLRNKFRMEQAKLLADARRVTRSSEAQPACIGSAENENAPAPAVHRPSASPLVNTRIPAETRPSSSPGAFNFGWYELGFAALSAAVEGQAVLAQCWLHLPPVATTLRAQLAVNSVAVAVCSRNRKHPFSRH